MKKSLIAIAGVAGALLAVVAAPAHADTRVHLNIGVPGVYVGSPGYVYAQPSYVYTQPGYVYYGQHNYYPQHNYHPRRPRGGWDQDHDGIPNRYDRDRDGDGVANRWDRRPSNPYRR